jgi:hypothetical protein
VAIAAFLLAKSGGVSFIATQQNVLLAAFNLTYITINAISAAGALLFFFIPKSAGTEVADTYE